MAWQRREQVWLEEQRALQEAPQVWPEVWLAWRGQEWLQPGPVQASQGLPQVWFLAWPEEWLAQAWAPPWLELRGQASSLPWGPPLVLRVSAPVLAWCLERED